MVCDMPRTRGGLPSYGARLFSFFLGTTEGCPASLAGVASRYEIFCFGNGFCDCRLRHAHERHG